MVACLVTSFVRKVPTASGARAVQVVHKRGRQVVGIDHIGSAHDDAELASLVEIARQRLHEGQGVLDLGDSASRRPARSGARVVATSSQVLWNVLEDAYGALGFDALEDEAFKALVLARIVEPTSKADTVRVLGELGVASPSLRTIFRCLAHVVELDYRTTLAEACWARRAPGRASLVLYDVTTLHFEIDAEDDLRRVGMSKERRVDPQIQVGLLVDPGGFPLEAHCFEGNRAEIQTLMPVIEAFRARHEITDLVVVADAGMLSAANLDALEDAGFSFIVGSRITKAPYDLAQHFETEGTSFEDGQVVESSRVMGSGSHARSRRVVYQYSVSRQRRDNRAIDAMVERAEKVAAGTRGVKKDRFVKLDGARKGVNWGLVERARTLAGLKGYVTNIARPTMTGQAVVSAYHDLWQVEKSFRMAKSDLRARPVFHHLRDSIEAHLTIVFAALAVSRHLQDAAGVSIRRLVRTLRPLRSVTIAIGDHTLTAEPTLTAEATNLLSQLSRGD